MDLKLKKFFKRHFLKKNGLFVDLPNIKGLKISTDSANLYKKKKRDDLCLFYFEDGANHAGVFTKSTAAAECVKWNKLSKSNKVKFLFVNTKNANALTGKQGFNSLKKIQKKISNQIKAKDKEFYFASTGVIGERFPVEKIEKKIPDLINKVKSTSGMAWTKAAKAIMTTDTIAKLSCKTFKIKNKKINIAGIAKGSGMIFPNMATMLGFIFTDLNISNQLLKMALKNNLEKTFNAISVDGDTSTNDMVLIFSTSKANNKKITNSRSKKYKVFESTLNEVMMSLAKQITIDGEGASKFIEIEVIKARNKKDAKQIAFSIANSQLFKTAVAGEDPNWGRILMAIGKSNVNANINKMNLKLGNQFIFKSGNIAKTYKESLASKYMKGCEITVLVDLGMGKSNFKAYTCDLTHEYISINADYRN
jgi:glutamate N-acetyltransferase/amino-acid N-acetyltransferase